MENKQTLIIGAHSDDMELSCSMFVANLIHHRVRVKSIVVALDRQEEILLSVRRSEAVEGAKVLGISPPLFLGYHIGQINYFELRADLKNNIRYEHPEQVLTHFPIDVHFDHALIGMIVNDIFQHEKMLFDLFFWKSPDSYSFVPTDDFTGDLNIKCEALRVHESQGFGSHTIEMMSEHPTEHFVKAIRRE